MVLLLRPQALLEAERSGTTWRDQGLKQAPHFLAEDGSVKVPQNWQSMVRSGCFGVMIDRHTMRVPGLLMELLSSRVVQWRPRRLTRRCGSWARHRRPGRARRR